MTYYSNKIKVKTHNHQPPCRLKMFPPLFIIWVELPAFYQEK